MISMYTHMATAVSIHSNKFERYCHIYYYKWCQFMSKPVIRWSRGLQWGLVFGPLCCYEGLQMGSPPERWCLCLCMMITWPSEAALQLCLLICRVNFIECSLGLFVVCHLLQYACWIPSSSASWATNTCFEILGPSCICFFLKVVYLYPSLL